MKITFDNISKETTNTRIHGLSFELSPEEVITTASQHGELLKALLPQLLELAEKEAARKRETRQTSEQSPQRYPETRCRTSQTQQHITPEDPISFYKLNVGPEASDKVKAALAVKALWQAGYRHVTWVMPREITARLRLHPNGGLAAEYFGPAPDRDPNHPFMRRDGDAKIVANMARAHLRTCFEKGMDPFTNGWSIGW